MPVENGDNVTWRELNLALKPIHMALLRIETRLDEEDKGRFLGPYGRTLLTALIIALAVTFLK